MSKLPHEEITTPNTAQVTGIMLCVASALTVVVMVFHPTGHSVEEIAEQRAVNQVVHGVLIVLLGVLVYGFACVAMRMGLRRVPIGLGLLGYVGGATAMIAAALVSGFVVPEFAGLARRGVPDETDIKLGIALAHSINQVCARFGVVGMSLAISVWSLGLVRQAGVPKTTAVIGLVVGPISILGVVSGHFHMNVHGMIVFVVSQTVWTVLIGVQLLRGRI